jgi:hypothetical protein
VPLRGSLRYNCSTRRAGLRGRPSCERYGTGSRQRGRVRNSEALHCALVNANLRNGTSIGTYQATVLTEAMPNRFDYHAAIISTIKTLNLRFLTRSGWNLSRRNLPTHQLKELKHDRYGRNSQPAGSRPFCCFGRRDELANSQPRRKRRRTLRR